MSNALNRALQTTSTQGTGTYSLDGSAPVGRQSMKTAAIASTGDGTGPWLVYYVVQNDTDWEIGTGTLTSGSPDTLARTTVHESSNAGAAVNWPAGTKTVFSGPIAQALAPTTPACMVHSTSTQAIPNATFTKILFDTEDIDQSLTFDLTNDHLTIPSTGVYLLSCTCTTTSSGGNIWLAFDGTRAGKSPNSVAVTPTTNGMTITATRYIASGVLVTAEAYHGGGGFTLQTAEFTAVKVA